MDEQKTTKKEKYLLKKEKKEKELVARSRRKKVKTIIAVSVPILLVLGGITLAIVNYSPEERHPGTPRMEISPKEYDAGTVSMSGGLVEYTYEIKNTGEGDLEIDGIRTSCHCTTAVLKVGGKTSPRFGMDTSSAFWSQRIAPGETGFLEVSFDPAYHGAGGMGFVVRAVYLDTNDPQQKNAEVMLSAKVIE